MFGYQKILVIGTSGVGKSTLAKELAQILNADWIELDSLYHGPNWTPVEPALFRQRVSNRLEGGRWVVDGNYESQTQLLPWQQADLVIWLDYSFSRVFYQVVSRTFRRLIKKEMLWNGNQESWRMTFSKESIIWWMVSTYHKRKQRIPGRLAQYSELPHLRFRSPRETRKWVEQVRGVNRSPAV